MLAAVERGGSDASSHCSGANDALSPSVGANLLPLGWNSSIVNDDDDVLDAQISSAVAEAMDGSERGAFLSYAYGVGEAYTDRLVAVLPSAVGLRVVNPSFFDAHANRGDDCAAEEAFSALTVDDLVVGALIDCRCELENAAAGAGALLELRKDTHLGVPTSEWLLSVSAATLREAFERYAALHDPWLAARLADTVCAHAAGERERKVQGHRASDRGSAVLACALHGLRDEIELEHGNRVPLVQLTRALRVFINDDELRLEGLLHRTLALMQMGGCVLVATYSPWEHAVVRRVIRQLEPPTERLLGGAVRCERLPHLYALLRRGQAWAVRRVNRVSDRVQGQHSLALHVLKKVPWEDPAPAMVPAHLAIGNGCATETKGEADPVAIEPRPPSFCGAVASAAVELLLQPSVETLHTPYSPSPHEPPDKPPDEPPDEPPDDAEVELAARLGEIRSEIAERKAWLGEQGLSAKASKKDSVLRALCQQQDRLHKAKLHDRIYARGVQRVHVSVLLHEAVEHLMVVGPEGCYVDCTFGRGGHSRHLLSRLSAGGRLFAFDIDPMSVSVGRALEQADGRFHMVHAPFAELARELTEPLAGVLLDLGVSSPQLDEASRGFSVKAKKDGPLDLRMNQDVGQPASEWLAAASAAEITWVLQQTCHALDPPLHARVAEELYTWQRLHGPFRSTRQFVSALRDLEAELRAEYPTLKLPTLVKTSLRIFLNLEMTQLATALDGAFERLQPAGRCCIICFNRWEVAAVRDFVRRHEEPSAEARRTLPPERLAALYPLLTSSQPYAVRRAVRPVRPSEEELARNQRAKSSLHVLEKVPRMWQHEPPPVAAPG